MSNSPKSKPSELLRPICSHCGAPLRRYRYREHQELNHGGKSQWGDYGDNIFCGLRCGYWWALSRFKDHGRS